MIPWYFTPRRTEPLSASLGFLKRQRQAPEVVIDFGRRNFTYSLSNMETESGFMLAAAIKRISAISIAENGETLSRFAFWLRLSDDFISHRNTSRPDRRHKRVDYYHLEEKKNTVKEPLFPIGEILH